LDKSAQISSPPPTTPEVATPNVAALTGAMRQGNESAFREFYAAYFDRLLRYLLVVTRGNEEAAHEALQLTLIRVARHIKGFAAEETFWSWLTVLARSALVDEARKRRRYLAFLDRFTREAETEEKNENAMSQDGHADARLNGLLERQLISLSDEERRLVEQKYILHQSVRDLANDQQTTEKAIESKLSRVRRKLKDAVLADLKNGSQD
jgi:RNA polymerase sigma-70 factor (ECF subfamily)